MLSNKINLNIVELPLAPIACSVYILSFGFPWNWDIPLVVLAILGIFVSYTGTHSNAKSNSSLNYSIIFFFAALLLAALFSQKPILSLILSLPMLPAVYIYYLIAFRFNTLSQIHVIYLSLSILTLMISIGLLITSILNPTVSPSIWVKLFPSPIIIVPNDTILFAITTPLSLALIILNRNKLIKAIAACSIIFSCVAIVLFQSRGALVALVLTLIVFIWYTGSKRILIIMICSGIALVSVDGITGFSLVTKFSSLSTGREPLWMAAWKMFMEQPILGLGPHMFALNHQAYGSASYTPWVHNLYLETLAEQGLIGFFALVSLFGFGLSKGWKISDSTLHTQPPTTVITEIKLFSLAAFCALLAFCTAAIYELTLLRVWVPVVLFSLLGVIVFLAQMVVHTKSLKINKLENDIL